MHALFSSPFRTFFMLANAYAVVAIGIWAFTVSGLFRVEGLSVAWHVREMLLGFVGTVMLGFLLTASANWTGQTALNGRPLICLALTWLCARIAWQWEDAHLVGAFLDALVYLGGAIKLGTMVHAAKNQRNYPFVVVLLLFSAFCFYEAMKNLQGGGVDLHSYLLLFFLMVHVVLVMGGRVIPFFSDRGLQREATVRYAWLERVCLAASILFIACLFLQAAIAQLAPQSDIGLLSLYGLAGFVAAVNFIRLITWRPWQTINNPMLWPLHLSYALVCLGFALFSIGVSTAVVMHVFAIGGFGLIIMSMTSRVSLGHTGRPLQLPKGMSIALYCVLFALITRIGAALYPQWYLDLILMSGLTWMAGFALYLKWFAPMLWRARVKKI